MAQEIERKFLVIGADWQRAPAARYRQGYLCRAPERTVRVRTIETDTSAQGVLTIKGASVGAARAEFEYVIPLAEAQVMLDTLCDGPLIEKTRRKVEHAGLTWEVDEFFGDNQGLILAEVELEQEEQTITKPSWIGQEVTGDPRYYNANLSVRPYRDWSTEE